MSRDPEDIGPARSRRPRPETDAPGGPSEHPRRAPVGGNSERSTFRPNPAGSRPESSRRAASGKPGRAGGDEPGSREPLAPGPKWWERIFFGRVSSGQLAQFCRQFGAYMNAGVDFNRALASLQQQFAMSPLGPVISRLRTAIQTGSTLEEAMAREPQVFSPMFLSMIRVAEARGGVPETLKMMGDHYESRQRLIRQARSAMIYPVIVLVIAAGVVALLTIVILPLFADLLRDISRKTELALPSRMLLAFSTFVRGGGWWLIPLVALGTPFLIARFYKTSAGKALIDRLILKTPVFGPLFRKLDTTRFARTLSTLLDAGVDVGTAIDLTAGVITMNPIRRAVLGTRVEVMSGRELSQALSPTGEFTPDVIAVLQTGEETGKIPESLDHLADDYEEQVSVMVKNLGHLVQPLITLILGAIVLFIILAVFLPYLQVITGLTR